MELKIETSYDSIPVKGESIEFTAYIARPIQPGSYPSIIIGMEIFGVNDHIKEICCKVAQLGFIVAAPDYYHRITKGITLGYSDEDRKIGLHLLYQLKREDVIKDTAAAMEYLEESKGANGKRGFIGFSSGGHIAYLCATQFPIDLTICFYAGWLTNTDIPLSQPQPTITLTSGITKQKKLVFFAGESDHLVTHKQLQEISKALEQANVRHEMIVYLNTKHGFFCNEREVTFNEAARNEAWSKIKSLLAEELVVFC